MLSSAVWQEWCLYNGAIGEAVDIIYRQGGRPPRPLPACILVAPPKYCGPVSPMATYHCPCFPYRAHNGLQAPLLKDNDSPYPHLGHYVPPSQGGLAVPGATQSARLSARRSHLSKSRTQAAYALRSPEISQPVAAYMASTGSRLLRFIYRPFAAASAFFSA